MHPPYAGIVSRISAIAVDALVLAVAVSSVAAGFPVVWEQVIGTPPNWVQTGAQWVGTLLPVVYFAGCWSVSGRTLGGLLMGTRVQRLDGSRVGFARALLRAVVGLLLVPVWVIGLVAILGTEKRQALHDKLFNTVVRFTAL
ncbi:putative RDD family membrane protein YckC [Allocatelliglobosispora scoriae]|uniref:Putative RDD family membrane protein YckC n=1 Tax=Allocatelliglobosispora scoriae TaxID=643052 RepID=A0A841BZB7_9ACTN|nr:RDD family protein [Allocatelliglobosispora scoriae]MBB5872838.1 putative RDD family membrane protein YckC [Allocatelliglobosispora scoriae]